jgi:hypothetical protein
MDVDRPSHAQRVARPDSLELRIGRLYARARGKWALLTLLILLLASLAANLP